MLTFKTKWYVCEYMGNGIWKPISFEHWDEAGAMEECKRLFASRSRSLPSIGVIDSDYLTEIGML